MLTREIGCVANPKRRRERDNRPVARSGGKQLELLGQGWPQIAGIPRLLLAHHVNHLDPTQDHTGSGHRLKTEHGSDPPLDGAMVLLDTIIEVGALPDANGLQITSRSFLEPVYGIAGQDRFVIGLAPVDDDPLGLAVSLEGLA